jgi:hypothetical protein
MISFVKTFSIFALIAAAPIIALKIYIQLSGDLDARWMLIRYGVLFAVWAVVFLGLGIYKGIKAG